MDCTIFATYTAVGSSDLLAGAAVGRAARTSGTNRPSGCPRRARRGGRYTSAANGYAAAPDERDTCEPYSTRPSVQIQHVHMGVVRPRRRTPSRAAARRGRGHERSTHNEEQATGEQPQRRANAPAELHPNTPALHLLREEHTKKHALSPRSQVSAPARCSPGGGKDLHELGWFGIGQVYDMRVWTSSLGRRAHMYGSGKRA